MPRINRGRWAISSTTAISELPLTLFAVDRSLFVLRTPLLAFADHVAQVRGGPNLERSGFEPGCCDINWIA